MSGRVSFLNPVAASLTGWELTDAVGEPLEQVFRIVNEESRQTVENPAIRALREGVVVGLANHTLLLGRNGSEVPIDDSAAPIRDDQGRVSGVVLVFRDVSERRRAERALRQSEERFRLLVESVREYAIFPLDPQGVVVGWNSGAERIKGYTREEIVGQHFSCFYPPEAIEAGVPSRSLEEAARDSQFQEEGWRVRKDGTRFWATVVITALRDERGDLRGFAKITRDLTEQKAAEDTIRANEQRLQALTHWAKDAIITADDEGRITSWNAAAASLFGYAQDEVLGGTLTPLMPPHYRAAHELGLERLRRTGESRLLNRTMQLSGLRRDGQEFPLELSLSSWKEGERRFYTAIIRDLTERQRLEEQRLQAERARTRAENLTENSRRKDEFLAMLSHELRNPLAAIVNSLPLLGLPNEDPDRSKAQRILHRQVTHLKTLVDDLFDVSRVLAGAVRLHTERLDWRESVQNAVDALRPDIERHRHDLQVSFPPQPVWVNADAKRLEQVATNLLTNAVKYTPDGGRIRVEITVGEHEARLHVRDNGLGIRQEILGRVFELFIQDERCLDQSKGGMGIGLAIVRRIVEDHGGTVTASSDGPGRGSEFSVTLPLVA